MTTFRVLVVDDEPLAREAAVTLLRRDPEIGGVEECADGLSARDSIARTRPDIVFLDIEMPGLSGVQLAEDLQSEPPVIVFTTAFSQYAVGAFEVAATDYVLKPFSDERFLEALGRAKRRVREKRLGGFSPIESAAKVAVKELRQFAAQQSVALAEEAIRRDLRTEDDRRIIGLNVEQLGRSSH